MVLRCVVCSTQGIPVVAASSGDVKSMVEKWEDVSKLVASIACLLFKSGPFSFSSKNIHYSVIPCMLTDRSVIYVVLFSESDSNEISLRGTFLQHKLSAEYCSPLVRVVQYLDQQSAHDLAHSTFADTLQGGEQAYEGGGVCLSEDTLEAVFGQDEAAREQLLRMEEHLLADVVTTPLSTSISDQWVASLRSTLSFLFPVAEWGSLHLLESVADADKATQLFAARLLLRSGEADQPVHSAAEQLAVEWLMAVALWQRSHHLRRQQGEKDQGIEDTCVRFRRPVSPASEGCSLLMAAVTDSLVLAWKVPYALLRENPADSAERPELGGLIARSVGEVMPAASLHTCWIHTHSAVSLAFTKSQPPLPRSPPQPQRMEQSPAVDTRKFSVPSALQPLITSTSSGTALVKVECAASSLRQPLPPDSARVSSGRPSGGGGAADRPGRLLRVSDSGN